MHVLIVSKSVIPVHGYGGTERVIWDLGKKLVELGHRVTYLVKPGSRCDFADVLPMDTRKPWPQQIPPGMDIAHFQFNPELPENALPCPFVITEHGNAPQHKRLARNTVFLSRDHAQRFNASTWVHNGLDWDAYGEVNFARERAWFHFLGKAAVAFKNVRGAIRVAQLARVRLDVLGGHRLAIRRGFRFTTTPLARFHGTVGGQKKLHLINGSRGLIFPVCWAEPFGLAIIESLYFGCPIFGTPHGALPELVPAECGVLSTHASVLAQAVRRQAEEQAFDPHACHRHAVQHFNATRMARDYLAIYQRLLNGETLNPEAPFTELPTELRPWHSDQ